MTQAAQPRAAKPKSSIARQSAFLVGIFIVLTGCAGGDWGARSGFPSSWQAVGDAAVEAARQPGVWVPLSGALVVGVGDLDDNISDWAVREQPLFGRNAADVSDTLLDVSLGIWAATTLLAPADAIGDRFRGTAVQASSIVLTGGISEGLKSLTGRTRPNDENNNSFPSGHASQAAVRSYWARTNLGHVDLPKGVQVGSSIALHSLGYATAWARVEANRHFPSDVLAGLALGNFMGKFMQALFFESKPEPGTGLEVQVLPGGAALHFSAPLR